MTDDPFNGCNYDEIFALILDQEGLDGLKILLSKTDLDREELEIAADNLELAGLIRGAEIIRAFSAKAETSASREITAIMADPLIDNQKCGLASLYRRGVIKVNDLPEDTDPDVIAYVAKARQ